MAQFVTSFFDRHAPKFKLWTKKVGDIQIDEINVIFKGTILKTDTKHNKLNERFFVLKTTHLC